MIVFGPWIEITRVGRLELALLHNSWLSSQSCSHDDARSTAWSEPEFAITSWGRCGIRHGFSRSEYVSVQCSLQFSDTYFPARTPPTTQLGSIPKPVLISPLCMIPIYPEKAQTAGSSSWKSRHTCLRYHIGSNNLHTPFQQRRVNYQPRRVHLMYLARHCYSILCIAPLSHMRI